jgi:glycosyltransferase involved in cell wall biosynthesis
VNVLLVTHRYPPEGVGGVERYTERLALELRRRGGRADVLARTPRRLPRRPKLERQDGVYRIVGSGVRLREFLLEHEATERAFSEVLAETRPDVVHVNHLIGISPRIVALARRADLPVVLSIHDYYAACPLVHLLKVDGRLCDGPDGGRECTATCFAHEGTASGRWTTRYEYFAELLQLADTVVCPTERLADFLREMAPEASFDVVGLGVDPAGSAAPATPDRLTFANVGTA